MRRTVRSEAVEAIIKSNRYPIFAVAIVVGGGFALWAGLPPFFLILLLACPLMMFFMMRGMNGDAKSGHGGSDSSHGEKQRSQPGPPSDLDGSHERIDRP